jgi:hypothetical protein
MVEITLVAWIVTALGGVALVVLWTARGGMRQAQDEGEVAERRKGVGRGTRADAPRPEDPGAVEPTAAPGISLHRVVPHASLAVAGLALWVGYVVRQGEPGTRMVPLLALIILLVVVGFGAAMFIRWRTSRATGHPAREAERRLPVLLVGLHGVAGATTLVLVVVVMIQETWPLLRDAFTGVRDPELETLAWMAGWVAIGAGVGVALHFAFGRRRERRPLGNTLLITAMAGLVAGGIGYFLLGLTGVGTLIFAMGGALLSSWGRTFGYAVPTGTRA